MTNYQGFSHTPKTAAMGHSK